jgi:small subunit ribosomal protein S4
MGDTKRFTNKYDTPSHPWRRERIEVESVLRRDFGLKNTREAWKASTKLKTFKAQIKSFVRMPEAQANVEREALTRKLAKYGLMPEDGNIEGVLGYNAEKILERRLQTVLVRRKLARTMNQARQFITHRHVAVNGRVITAPGYLVPVVEENSITFKVNSSFIDEQHPERMSKEDAAAKRAEEKEAKRKLDEAKAIEDAEVIEVTEEDSE